MHRQPDNTIGENAHIVIPEDLRPALATAARWKIHTVCDAIAHTDTSIEDQGDEFDLELDALRPWIESLDALNRGDRTLPVDRLRVLAQEQESDLLAIARDKEVADPNATEIVELRARAYELRTLREEMTA